MKIEKININDIKPAEYNPRVMPDSEMQKLEKNMETFGLVDPIIIDLTDNNTIIGGHQRYQALLNKSGSDTEGYDKELNLIRLGDIGWIFTDTNLKIKDKNSQKALNIALNKINGDWDYPKLDEIITELETAHYDLELTGFDEEELIFDDENFELTNTDEESEEKENSEKYTQSIKTPIYEPSDKKPSLNELYNMNKTEKLIQEINKLPLTDDVKIFLKYTAYRFIEFNYDKIADYYAHSDEKLQTIMEKLGLIIIDYNKAVENGFIRINKIIDDTIQDGL